jgi:cytochrome c-type biogenesis protein CcmH/NrfG
MLAAGGALGGIFVAVVAPKIFSDFFELHLGLLACGVLFLLVCARNWNRRLRGFGVVSWGCGWVALLVLGWLLWSSANKYDSVRVFRVRNFYGVFNVYRHDFPDPNLSLVELVHGRIAHGMQFLHARRAGQPTLYYGPGSGIDLALRTLSPGKHRIGVVGLGAGTMAAYGQPGDQFRFYEINPQIEQVARTYFTYLKNSPAEITIVPGDARLSLEREAVQNFDLLALDAFNSDSIPIHLLTREAFEEYQRHVNTNGLIAVHVSNASLNLEPVLARLAAEMNYTARVVEQNLSDESQGVLPSIWLLLSRDSTFAEKPELRIASRPASVQNPKAQLWTDDFSALFSVLRWREFPGGAAPDRQESQNSKHSATRNELIAAQIAGFRETLRRDPGSTVALNNLGFLLATAPDAALRNGAEAVSYAEKASAQTGQTNIATLATLAAAYAEAGRFDEAVTTAEKTCKLAAQSSNPALLQHNMELLERYRRRQPFHQQPR